MASPDRISIVAADHHPIFLEGLAHLIGREDGLHLAGAAGDAQTALQQVRELRPDVLLLEGAMPRESALDVLRELARLDSPARIILLTAAITEVQSVEALRLGVRGIVLKDASFQVLVKAIRLVMEGQYWVGRGAVSSLVTALRRVPAPMASAPTPFGLTPRQVAIIRAVATGATNRDIATQLGISEDTVKQHVAAVFDKCGVSTRVELVFFAVNHHLIDS